MYFAEFRLGMIDYAVLGVIFVISLFYLGVL